MGWIPVGVIAVCGDVAVRNVVRSCDKPWGGEMSVDDKWAGTTTVVFGPILNYDG